ncbi:glutathione peroxidase [Bacillus sp. FJAT-45037]|uniref:glutathione peroxidase n=1 Tax=Bacillus sp. FJAT-45037 TaxID=2011007 RepID=UPI000C240A25|nr:glutathione peroxidase [Bacillus sp. FJAT-45037]
MATVHDFTVETPKGKKVSLTDFEGKVMVIVNTATKCGLAPQFDGLEKLHQQYKDKGLVVLGFPCNQFMNQEPVSNDQMTEACKVNFGVTFPLFAKIKVNGSDAHPLYKHLKDQQKGMLGQGIKWNFTKFLIDQKGNVIKRYSPNTSPEAMEEDIKRLLEA